MREGQEVIDHLKTFHPFSIGDKRGIAGIIGDLNVLLTRPDLCKKITYDDQGDLCMSIPEDEIAEMTCLALVQTWKPDEINWQTTTGRKLFAVHPFAKRPNKTKLRVWWD